MLAGCVFPALSAQGVGFEALCVCAFLSHLRLRTSAMRVVRSCGLRLDPANEPPHCFECYDSQWHHNFMRDLHLKFLVLHRTHDLTLCWRSS